MKWLLLTIKSWPSRAREVNVVMALLRKEAAVPLLKEQSMARLLRGEFCVCVVAPLA